MNAAEKGKLLRMAGNIAAGLAPVYYERSLLNDVGIVRDIAKNSIEIAEAIIKQVNEKYKESEK